MWYVCFYGFDNYVFVIIVLVIEFCCEELDRFLYKFSICNYIGRMSSGKGYKECRCVEMFKNYI